MESISFQFNQIKWNASFLGEKVILLEAPKGISIDTIHTSSHIIEKVLGSELKDIVPAYDSIALFTSVGLEDLGNRLNSPSTKFTNSVKRPTHLKIPICYEFGLDLVEISDYSGLSENRIIDIHLAGTYRSLFVGFTPGFIYSDGLDSRLACPRKANPRTHIPAGSVGIGGAQTGIYSLDSPGGWNIIGRTPMTLFDIRRNPPMTIDVGTTFSFERISKDAFESWGE